MINANTVCENLDIIKIMSALKSVVTIVTIAVPILIVVYSIIDAIKTLTSSEADTKKMFNSIIKRLLAGALVFLVPVIVKFILDIIPSETNYYLACYQNATDERIDFVSEKQASKVLNELEENLVIASKNVTEENYNVINRLYQESLSKVNSVTNEEKRKQLKGTLSSKYARMLNISTAIKNLKVNVSIYTKEEEEQSQEGMLPDSTPSPYKNPIEYVKNNLPRNISEVRKNLVLKAASYYMQIPYVWGGYANSSGNFPKGGLDCSHFVDFIYWQITGNNLGNSNTTYIWKVSTQISESQLKPGDLGFKCIPGSCTGSNHVGIYAGTDEKGNKIWIHETRGAIENVTINNSEGFHYYVRPNGVDFRD